MKRVFKWFWWRFVLRPRAIREVRRRFAFPGHWAATLETGTAGERLEAGDAVYIGLDGKLYRMKQ